MKAIVEAKQVSLLNRTKVPVMSVNPKNERPVDEGNWRYEDKYTVHRKGDKVEVDDVTFRNLSRKGALVAA